MAALPSLPIGFSGTSSISEVLRKLATTEHGLSQTEVALRHKRYGPNTLVTKNNQNLLVSFVKQFLNPLIILLLTASVISATLGQIIDFIIIACIIIISVAIDFYQQAKAEHAVEKLREKVSITATVYRDGVTIDIPMTQLVPGDVIEVSPGTIIPADCRILRANDLLVDESILTGESDAQEKGQHLLDKQQLLFLGTHVISGSGVAVVYATGKQTAFGAIGASLSEKIPETAFEQGLKHFGYLLIRITFVLTIFVFFVNAFLRHDVLNSFIFALALAVGLTPELLPIIITLTLSRGALRMANKGVIVKYLPAIQNLGSMEVLCTDKTGTLTENKITLEQYEDISGQKSTAVLRLGFLQSHFESGIKNPLDEAILRHHEIKLANVQKINELTFDFNRRRASTIIQEENQPLLICKGATDQVLAVCSHFHKDGKQYTLSESVQQQIHDRFISLSEQGFRVLAVATKKIAQQHNYTLQDESNLTFEGLMAFFDPPKQTAKETLRELAAHGIAVKILTGDNEIVTKKICQELELPVIGVITGVELDKLSTAELTEKVLHTTIFARITPEQKQRIIKALQTHCAVGFLGDGINDAPSLHIADVGISVNNGTDVAKEAASLILLTHSLKVVKDGVIEGRKTYVNTMKYIMMATSSNFGNMVSVAAASLFLPFLPMLPTQILLNNLLYDVSQLAIASDKVDPEYLHNPKKWDIHFIKRFMLLFGPVSSLFDGLTFLALTFIFHATVAQFRTGWFIESLASQALIILVIRTKKVPFNKSKPSRLLLISTITTIAVAIFLPLSPLATFFEFNQVPILFYVYLLTIMIIYVVGVELIKHHFYIHKSSARTGISV